MKRRLMRPKLGKLRKPCGRDNRSSIFGRSRLDNRRTSLFVGLRGLCHLGRSVVSQTSCSACNNYMLGCRADVLAAAAIFFNVMCCNDLRRDLDGLASLAEPLARPLL